MKSVIVLLLMLCISISFTQNNVAVKIDGKDWETKSVSAWVESVMDLTFFNIICTNENQRFDISIDYNAIKGKSSAEFTFSENLMAPPGGASISFAPLGLGKQQWVTAEGKLILTEFNEEKKVASGTFESTLTEMLYDNGKFILTTPKQTKKIFGEFQKVSFVIK